MKILLSGACGPVSRAIARSIRMSDHFKGACIVGTDICQNVFGQYEGLCDRLYRVPHCCHPDYAAAIIDIQTREGVDLALVVPELEVLTWTKSDFPIPALLPPRQFADTAISKARLYAALDGTGLIPAYQTLSREQLLSESPPIEIRWPLWIRDCRPGSTSGRGAFLAYDAGDLRAWLTLNRDLSEVMISEFLPGRNFACQLLYHGGHVLKTASCERLEYFMSEAVLSGVSGYTSRGRLINDQGLAQRSKSAVEHVCSQFGETMQGLVTVDLREDAADDPKITEINLRHVAFTSAFSLAGFNLVEAQIFATLGRPELAGSVETEFPPRNMIVRDFDGACRTGSPTTET